MYSVCTGTVYLFRRPASDEQRHQSLVSSLHTPLQHTQRRPGGKRSGGVFESEGVVLGEERLVDVGVRLKLEAGILAKLQRDDDLPHAGVRDEKLQVAFDLLEGIV